MLGVGLGLTTIRRAGGAFAPSDIANLYAWWDASDTSTITESGGLVSQVDNKVSGGLNLVQASAALQPSTGVATLNGLNVLRQTGSDAIQTSAGVPSGNYSLFFVVSGTTATAGGTFAGSATQHIGFFQSGSTSTGIAAGVSSTLISVNGVTLTTRGQIYTAYQSPAVVTFPDPVFPDGLVWETRYPSVFVNGPQDIGEILMYSRHLSAAELTTVEGYLAGKWGVTFP